MLASACHLFSRIDFLNLFSVKWQPEAPTDLRTSFNVIKHLSQITDRLECYYSTVFECGNVIHYANNFGFLRFLSAAIFDFGRRILLLRVLCKYQGLHYLLT